ncbi:MAG TPA: hypothetical protein VK550_11875, partial [Polyangiaceae bacterium]|nr:hypothetical protein [Polyangiaceae bacterium]
REARGYVIGTNPYAGGDDATPIGSRLALQSAKDGGANFLTPSIRKAVLDCLAVPVPHRMLAEDRLWADLLSSMPLCFNLFGDVFGDTEYAARAVRAWWPDAPRGAVTVRFEHSPGRCDPAFLGNKSAFDVAFEIGSGDKDLAIIGVETKYHEDAKVEPEPKPKALARYVEVTERSMAFIDGWRELVIGTELQQIWLDHLLLLSMLQHPSGRWTWGRFVLLYPSGNPSFARAAAAYRAVLRDPATFEARTIEALLAPTSPLKVETAAAFRERYFW